MLQVGDIYVLLFNAHQGLLWVFEAWILCHCWVDSHCDGVVLVKALLALWSVLSAAQLHTCCVLGPPSLICTSLVLRADGLKRRLCLIEFTDPVVLLVLAHSCGEDCCVLQSDLAPCRLLQ